jgi:hypothetical protein
MLLLYIQSRLRMPGERKDFAYVKWRHPTIKGNRLVERDLIFD